MALISPGNRVLVLGASGTTGRRVLRQLRERGHEAVGASRSLEPAFDWHDPSTWDELLGGVHAVYLLPPVGALDPEPSMTAFVEHAVAAGVQRFVLLSATVIEEGDPGVGRIHALLRREAPQWAVLRPSWFMQNFAEGHYMAADLNAEGRMTTSTGSGRVPFVDADDIAAVAVGALTDAQPHQGDLLITGPEALSYDQVAEILSRVSGRRIEHRPVPRDLVVERIARDGVSRDFAAMLAALEAHIADGGEDRVTDVVERYAGRPPRSFEDWATAHAESWRR